MQQFYVNFRKKIHHREYVIPTVWQKLHLEWFSLALYESVIMSDTVKVFIFIRGGDKSNEVYKKLQEIEISLFDHWERYF